MSTNDAMLGSSAAAASSVRRPPATAMTSNASSKKILHQKRWVCDVCKVKWFLDFDEACAHEEQCKGAAETQSSSSVSGTVSKRAEVNNECAAMSNSTVTMSAKRKDDGASPTITPPPQSKKAAAILAAARAKARGIPPVDQVERKQKTIDIEILSDTSDNAMNEVQLVEGRPTKDSSSKRKSKRLRDATPPAKSNHDCSSSNEMNGKKKKTTKPKAVMPKTNKLAVNKSNTSSSKSKKTEKKGGGPIASIFLPKSQQQQQEQKKGDTNHNSKKRAVTTNNVPSKKRNQRSIPSSTKREVLEIDSSSDDDDDDEVVVVEKPNKQTKTKKKKNAVLGLSKEELREHQAADFFARRKKKAEEEKERQRKRNEARMARLNSKESSLKSGGDAAGAVKSSSNVASSTSVKAAPIVAGGATATKKISSESSQHNIKAIPAPRFPCPSHIIPKSDDSDTASKSPAGTSSSVLSQTPKFQHSKQSMTASSDEDEEATTMPLSFLDKSDPISSESSIFSLFFSCNAIMMINDDDESPALASQLWVDKYTMRKIPDDVIGIDNKEASKKLVEFVEEWKVRRHMAMQSMGQVKRKKKKKRKKKSSNGYDSDDSFLDDGGLENVFFISGPTASGKTRLVHAVAEQCECVVIEINTAEQRSGQALKRAVQETTQSHSSLAMSKRKQGATGFFESSTDDLVDSDSDRYDSDSDEDEKQDGHSLTIILIDEGKFNCVLCSFHKRDVIVALNSYPDLQSTFYSMTTLRFGRHLLN